MEDFTHKAEQKSHNSGAHHSRNHSISQSNHTISEKPSVNENQTRPSAHPSQSNRISHSSRNTHYELKATNHALKCSDHADEELQFYCLNDNRLLCGECVVSSICSGHHVINFKKASAKIKRKLDELVCEMDSKANTYALWEKKIESNKEDFNDVISSYKEQVVACMLDLKKKVEAKQEELLQRIEKITNERTSEFEVSLKHVREMKEEILDIKDAVETNVKNLDEANVCDYYAKKNDTIKELLNDEKETKLNEINILINNTEYQEQYSLKKFQEDFEVVVLQVTAIGGLEEINKLNELRYTDVMQSPLLDNQLKFHKSPQLRKPDTHSRNVSRNFESLLKSHTYSSPSKLISHKGNFSPDTKSHIDENAVNSLQARGQNIHKILDRIFQAKNKKAEEKSGTVSQENAKPMNKTDLETTSHKFSYLNKTDNDYYGHIEKPHVNNSKDDDPMIPLGHTPVYEKNIAFRTSFIPDLNPPVKTEGNSFTSPQLRSSGIGQRSSLLTQAKEKVTQNSSRTSYREIKIDPELLSHRQTHSRTSKDLAIIRGNSAQKKTAISTKAASQIQNIFFSQSRLKYNF